MTLEPLRIVFMGTPSFAVPTLAALLDAGHQVVGVYTQPDRRAGRGRRLTPPPVKVFATDHSLDVFQPESLRDASAGSELAELAPEAIVVAAYGIFLPKQMLDLPRLGCLNVHPSLLPRHRGASPVVTALLNGDRITGVTVMLLDEGMDTGSILAQQRVSVGPEEYADHLTERLFVIGSELLVSTLEDWNVGRITPTPQHHELATITRRLTREDGLIDWSEPAAILERQVRAYTPWPGSFTVWQDRVLKIGRARTADSVQEPPGTVVRLPSGEIAVATSCGALKLITVQLEGGRRVDASAFAHGRNFIGSKLGG